MAAGTYGDLTKAERAHWDEYQTLREISDWAGFDAAQEQRKEAARKWLVEKRKEIWRVAQKKPKGDGKGWNHANRRERYDMLRDENLNKGAPKHEVRLPAPAVCTNAEKVYIEEREGYLAFASTTTEQKQRKLDNLAWLVTRRKQLYRLIKDDSTEGRERRYDALCIATSHGQVYKTWDKKHNKWGVPYGDEVEGGGRQGIVRWAEKYIGVGEPLAPTEASRSGDSRCQGEPAWLQPRRAAAVWLAEAGLRWDRRAVVRLLHRLLGLGRWRQGQWHRLCPTQCQPGSQGTGHLPGLHHRPEPRPTGRSLRSRLDQHSHRDRREGRVRVHRRQHRPQQRGQRRNGHEDSAPWQHRRLYVDPRPVS